MKKDRERKQKERAALKLNKQKYELVKAKDRQRKKLKKQAILEQSTEPTASTPTPFGSVQFNPLVRLLLKLSIVY